MKVRELVEGVLQLPEPQKSEAFRRILDGMDLEWEDQELLVEAERRDRQMDTDPSSALSEKDFIDSFSDRLGKSA